MPTGSRHGGKRRPAAPADATAMLAVLCGRVAERVLRGPDAADLLGWHAGTAEYWIHAIVAAEARRLGGWAASTEVPYITRAKVASPAGEKWSDGAVGWAGAFGALIEAKALVAHTPTKVRSDVRSKVAADLDALLGVDWPATLSRRPGRYEDGEWSGRRAGFGPFFGLQVLVVHGARAGGCIPLVAAAAEEGADRLLSGYGDTPPPWAAQLRRVYRRGPLLTGEGGVGTAAGCLFAWAVPLPAG